MRCKVKVFKVCGESEIDVNADSPGQILMTAAENAKTELMMDCRVTTAKYIVVLPQNSIDACLVVRE